MRYQRDVLRRRAPLDILLDALADVDRLVLLGDVIDLSGHDPQDALAVAAPVLRALGQRLGPNREVIVVPGNHDRRFVAPWIQAMGVRLSVDSSVPLDATPELAVVSGWLAPARVSARYPGVWLAERVWATHGHYLNRDLGPAWSLGITRGQLGRVPHEVARPIDYEPSGGLPLRSAHEAISGALPKPLGEAADRLGVVARAATMTKVPQTAAARAGGSQLTASKSADEGCEYPGAHPRDTEPRRRRRVRRLRTRAPAGTAAGR
jgi:hypothetical protein